MLALAIVKRLGRYTIININTAIHPLPCLKPDQSDPEREVNIPRNEQRLVTMFIGQFVNAIVSPIGTQDRIVEKLRAAMSMISVPCYDNFSACLNHYHGYQSLG